jgi:hypothetical protein
MKIIMTNGRQEMKPATQVDAVGEDAVIFPRKIAFCNEIRKAGTG